MGEVITDVGIDLDGVIYPFVDSFRAYCQERLGVDNLTTPTHWHFYEDWGLDSETFNAWLLEASKTHQIFSSYLPYEGVLESWKELRDMGVNIHVITARPQSAWAQTVEWLAKYNLHVDSLHFCSTKGFLSKVATGKAMMLDDQIVYYEEAEKAGIIPCLLTRDWNKSKEDANRVSNLPEFVSFVRGYNLKGKTVKKELTMPKPLSKDYPSIYTKKQQPFPYKPHRLYDDEPRWNNDKLNEKGWGPWTARHQEPNF
jgi:uncharacterized HAD superfamily protein